MRSIIFHFYYGGVNRIIVFFGEAKHSEVFFNFLVCNKRLLQFGVVGFYFQPDILINLRTSKCIFSSSKAILSNLN